MSLEVGAGIKRQAEEGFLFEAGGKEGISGAPFNASERRERRGFWPRLHF